jgi:hypothetical protein
MVKTSKRSCTFGSPTVKIGEIRTVGVVARGGISIVVFESHPILFVNTIISLDSLHDVES